MKKAQILSAIALAFALGVVIPVAGANAEIVKTNKDGALVIDEEETEKVETAVEDGKGSCGWHLVSNVKTWFYDQFLALDTAIEQADKKIEDQKKFNFDGSGVDATGNSTTSLKAKYAERLTALKTVVTGAGETLPTSLKETFTDSVKTYADAVRFISAARVVMADQSTKYSSNTTIAEAYRNVAIDLENALKNAADDIETVEEWASDKLVQPKINAITEDTEINENMTYAQAVAKAKALTTNENGTCNITKAKNIKKAVDYAEGLIDSLNSFYSADAEKAIANIKKAMNGGTVTDADVEKPNTDSNIKPGNTGALNSTAEGTASTTVSIVAGLATALTALGAGVVAYRNARRSSEN